MGQMVQALDAGFQVNQVHGWPPGREVLQHTGAPAVSANSAGRKEGQNSPEVAVQGLNLSEPPEAVKYWYVVCSAASC
jgi:hypothetical protein